MPIYYCIDPKAKRGGDGSIEHPFRTITEASAVAPNIVDREDLIFRVMHGSKRKQRLLIGLAILVAFFLWWILR